MTVQSYAVATAITLLAALGGCARTSRLGPVTVVVTDERTGSPIAGVPVDAAWVANRMRGGLGGMIEPIIGTKVVLRGHAVTDSTGTARLAAGSTRLPSNEQVFRLHLFVNLEVDPSAPGVVSSLATLRERCRRDAQACSGEPSLVDAALALLSQGNGALFRNPQPAHRGLALMVEDFSGAPDWSTPKDPFHLRWVTMRPEGDLHLDATLEPAPPSANGQK